MTTTSALAIKTHRITAEGHTLLTAFDPVTGLVLVWVILGKLPLGSALALDPNAPESIETLMASLDRLLPPQSPSHDVHRLALRTYALVALTPYATKTSPTGASRWLAVALGVVTATGLLALAAQLTPLI